MTMTNTTKQPNIKTTDDKTNTTDQTLESQLCHRLYVLSNAVTRTYRPLLEAVNLTYPQYVVMMALWQQHANNQHHLSIGELQKITSIDNGCLSLMLKKMVNKGVIELTANPLDKRSKMISLSQVGIDLEQQAGQEKAKIQQQQQDTLSEEDYQNLTHLLDKLKKGLDI